MQYFPSLHVNGFPHWWLRLTLLLCMLVLGAAIWAQTPDSIQSGATVVKAMEQYQDSLPNKDSLRKAGAIPPPATAPAPGVQPESDSILQNALKPIAEPISPEKKHTPQGATLRSLILPGWGQAYNHEYWKVPLAVAAVGIPIYLFIDNTKEYRSASFAYNTVFEELPIISGGKGKLDPKKFNEMEQKFQDAYNTMKANGGNAVKSFLSSLQNYRNTFRQYRDYSIVAALLGWGLNIADATVFGHLRGFDVGPDLSMKVRPVYLQYARVPGIGFTFSLK